MLWRIGPGTLDLEHPAFLGILNITPDSFSDGGRHLAPDDALGRAKSLLEDGATVLDLGAESTRPGAAPVSPDEEWARLQPVLALLRRVIPDVPLSLDTRHPEVARKGLDAGATILNDISGFSDPALLALAREGSCGLIAMRSRMSAGKLHMPEYAEVGTSSPGAAFQEMHIIKDRLLEAGIAPDRLLLDPGFGFGTVYSEDLALWNALPEMPRALDWPAQRFCIGVSRKRFLARRAGFPALPPDQRDELTHQAHAEAMGLGYRIFRTHTVNRSSTRNNS